MRVFGVGHGLRDSGEVCERSELCGGAAAGAATVGAAGRHGGQGRRPTGGQAKHTLPAAWRPPDRSRGGRRPRSGRRRGMDAETAARGRFGRERRRRGAERRRRRSSSTCQPNGAVESDWDGTGRRRRQRPEASQLRSTTKPLEAGGQVVMQDCRSRSDSDASRRSTPAKSKPSIDSGEERAVDRLRSWPCEEREPPDWRSGGSSSKKRQ